MPNYTTNYNLKKPLQEEFYNVDDFNENADIIDGILKALSEDSGVVISSEEPEKGDVWIDTDEEIETGSSVSSVNGKTGDVVLNPSDIGAVSSVNGKKNDVVLVPSDIGAANENHTHTASDVGAASAQHGHPATDISGILPLTNGGTGKNLSSISELATAMGAAQIATGSFTGQYKASFTVTFPFSPKFIYMHSVSSTFSVIDSNLVYIDAGRNTVAGGLRYSSAATVDCNVTKNGNTFTFTDDGSEKDIQQIFNKSDVIISWVAFA